MRILTAMLLTIVLAVTPVPCQAQTGYTSPPMFSSAITGYSVRVSTSFDGQDDETKAVKYGIMGISASGLDSDGATVIKLGTIATGDFPAASPRNSLGVSWEDHQFLAGNGDVITFTFTRPVHAFGLCLIGNPSPTGKPAIPFWKLRVNTDPDFEAFSAIDPLTSLGEGNDIYFLGVVSPEVPFTEAVLYSDNDPAAVYSFNVDDVVFAVDAQAVSLGDAKALASGDVVISDVIVTRVHSDRFNVETEDRSFGMAVKGAGATRGKRVSLFGGVTGNSDGERVLELAQILSQTDATPPQPLGMTTRSVGGSQTVGLQIGCPDSIGPNNIGLDVKVWGKITAIAPDFNWITVDDGVGHPSGEGPIGLAVVGAINARTRQVGDCISVTGSSSMFGATDGSHSLIRVAQPEDIVEQ